MLLYRLSKMSFDIGMMPLVSTTSEVAAMVNLAFVVEEHVPIYIYDPQKLVTVYATAAAVVCTMALLGIIALHTNVWQAMQVFQRFS